MHTATLCKHMHLKAFSLLPQNLEPFELRRTRTLRVYTFPILTVFYIPLCWCTHGGRARASGPLTVALLPITIPPVKSDPLAWNRIECNGHREFPVSSDKWPGPGSGSADSGAVWLITPAADTNTATGFVCRLPNYPHFPQHAHIMSLALFISRNFKPKSKGPFSFFPLQS